MRPVDGVQRNVGIDVRAEPVHVNKVPSKKLMSVAVKGRQSNHALLAAKLSIVRINSSTMFSSKFLVLFRQGAARSQPDQRIIA